MQLWKKRNGKEELSKRTSTIDALEHYAAVHKEYPELEFVEAHISKICKQVSSPFQFSPKEIVSSRQLAEGFDYCSKEIEENYGTWNSVGGWFEKMAALQHQITDAKIQMGDELDRDISLQCAHLLDNNIQTLYKAQKQKYEQTLASLNNSLHVLKNLEEANKKTPQPNIFKTENECERLQQELDSVAQDTLKTMAEVSAYCQLQVMAMMCIYLEATKKYLENSLMNVQTLLTPLKQFQHKQKHEFEQLKAHLWTDRRVFGADLQSILQREGSKVPFVVVQLVNRLRSYETEVGIFRMSGAKSKIDAVKRGINSGKNENIMEMKDFNVVAGLLKQFLRELKPEPLLTFRLYPQFVQVAEEFGDEETIPHLKSLVDTLPPPNQRLLHFLMQFLASVASKASQNKMNAANLGTVIAPTILYPPDERQHNISGANRVVELMIQYYDPIFGHLPVEVYPDGLDKPPEKNEAIRAFEGRLLKRRSRSTSTLPSFHDVPVRNRSNSVADSGLPVIHEVLSEEKESPNKAKKKPIQRRESEYFGENKGNGDKSKLISFLSLRKRIKGQSNEGEEPMPTNTLLKQRSQSKPKLVDPEVREQLRHFSRSRTEDAKMRALDDLAVDERVSPKHSMPTNPISYSSSAPSIGFLIQSSPAIAERDQEPTFAPQQPAMGPKPVSLLSASLRAKPNEPVALPPINSCSSCGADQSPWAKFCSECGGLVSIQKQEIKEVPTNMKPEVVMKIKPEVQMKVKPEVQMKIKPEVQMKVKPEVPTRSKPEVPMRPKESNSCRSFRPHKLSKNFCSMCGKSREQHTLPPIPS